VGDECILHSACNVHLSLA